MHARFISRARVRRGAGKGRAHDRQCARARDDHEDPDQQRDHETESTTVRIRELIVVWLGSVLTIAVCI